MRSDGHGNSRLGSRLRVRGRIAGEGIVALACRFEGRVDVRGAVVVATDGHVEASIRADRVTVRGSVRGDIVGDHVTIADGGQLEGDVRAAVVEIEDGATLAGAVDVRFDEASEVE